MIARKLPLLTIAFSRRSRIFICSEHVHLQQLRLTFELENEHAHFIK